MQNRITPACAGNSCSTAGGAFCYWDHPRVCGEQYANPRSIDMDGGSPPRVRGTERHAAFYHSLPGITPACAGNRRGK